MLMKINEKSKMKWPKLMLEFMNYTIEMISNWVINSIKNTLKFAILRCC